MEIEVKGHSGCSIEILREDKDLFICKSSRDPKYVLRLVKQAEKQQQAALYEYQHVRIPQIYDVEYDERHASIKMEYVYSRNFIEYFESAGFEQIDYFIKALILFVEKELKESPIHRVPTSVTMEKFIDVEDKVKSNSLLQNDEEINRIMKSARTIIETLSLNEYIEMPVGICHGDLTFSNILFNGNNYYLIDFLDSFIESPLMDIIKIRQDSFHLWSQMMYTKPFDGLRLKIICEKIDKEINRYFSRYEWYTKNYDVYQLLNLLRILQYAKEEKVVSFLKSEILKILNNTSNQFELEQTQKNIISESFSLIVPAASDNPQYQDVMPYVFSLDTSGIMLCLRAIQGLDLNRFDNIYITILKKHADKYSLRELFELQFKRLRMSNAKLVVLEEVTSSQTETVFKTIESQHIVGSIFIKDADGYFEADVLRENGIALYPLEQLSMVDPQHKSYVAVDDGYYITNIIECKIVSHLFNVGGVCFKDINDFVNYYKTLIKYGTHVCMSHIIYAMLLNKQQFRPTMALNYIDWGNKHLYNYFVMHNDF